MLRVLIAALAVTTAFRSVATASPEVKEILLNQGTVEGVKENILGDSSGRFFYSFRGIPYAAPPVGDLRFRDPEAPESWSGIRKGVTPPVCPQASIEAFLENRIDFVGEEDCLYLHVYTPKPYAADLPVMVFIHGGGFLLGDADLVGGTPQLLLREDIVLVSIQYRLGTLGFLSTGDSVLPGNLGMKDQSFALKWVQDNIHHFGGDPNTVTIFGESAGSASTHYHVLTPYSKGLFHRAILQSGTPLNPWAIRYDHAERALNVAKNFDCPSAEDSSPDSTQLVQCLREAPLEELVLAAMKGTVNNMPFFMVPRVDGDYLPDHPAQLLRGGRYHKVDLMSGLCQNEGASFIIMLLKNETFLTNFLENFSTSAPKVFATDNEDDPLYILRRAFYHFVGAVEVSDDSADRMVKLFSDIFMNIGHDEATALHGRDTRYGKHTYRYELQHRPELSLGDMYNFTLKNKAAKEWVSHADDLPFLFDGVFGMPRLNRTDDVFLSDIMVTLWTNFAKTGNPTPDLKLGFKWTPMESEDDMRYLSLVPAPMMREDNRAENREFWRNMPMKTNKLLFPDRFACSEDFCPR